MAELPAQPDDRVDAAEHILAFDSARATAVVTAFDEFVAEPLARKVSSLAPKDIARRNPFVYAAFGTMDIEAWVDAVARDIVTSSTEGLVGGWLEEVARIACGGVKPGGGVDLQRDLVGDDGERVVEIYAIQSTTNTKNSGGTRSDTKGLEASAAILRAQRRHVDLFVGYLFGRKRTTLLRGVVRLSSQDFWIRMSGDPDFQPKLLSVCVILASSLGSIRSLPEHLIAETKELYGDEQGRVAWDKVIAPPAPERRSAPKRTDRRADTP